MKSTFLSLTKMNSDLTVKVAVENTTYVFDKLFDYLVPSALPIWFRSAKGFSFRSAEATKRNRE